MTSGLLVGGRLMRLSPISAEILMWFEARVCKSVLSTRVALELQNFVTCDLTWNCLI